MNKATIVYAGNTPPESFSKSIFLIGPTPRKGSGVPWRMEMIKALEGAGYDGVIYVPEPEDGDWPNNYDEQVDWERQYINECDVIVAWVPRNIETMPAFTTNVEFGEALATGKLVYGRPDGAPKTRYLDSRYKSEWGKEPCSTMNAVAEAVVARIGEGAERTKGLRSVPLDIYRSLQFQSWYKTQSEAGNRLDGARVLWVKYVGPKKNFLFTYALHVNMWVESEQRHKSNEFIISRTDIMVVVPWYKSKSEPTIEIVLVKEFRSPGRTGDGFVHELPGGSSMKPNQDALEVASHELEEETSLRIDSSRFHTVFNNTRQLAATFSTHQATIFSVELTIEEFKRAKKLAASGKSFGVEGDSEKTYVEVMSLSGILVNQLLDWTQLGMLFQVARRYHWAI